MAFSESERRVLLAAQRLGPRVIQRLEQIGVDSLAKLKAMGADAAVHRICEQLGSTAWANRRRALRQLCQDLD